MNDAIAWKALEVTDDVLETALAGTISWKVESFTMVYGWKRDIRYGRNKNESARSTINTSATLVS